MTVEAMMDATTNVRWLVACGLEVVSISVSIQKRRHARRWRIEAPKPILLSSVLNDEFGKVAERPEPLRTRVEQGKRKAACRDRLDPLLMETFA
jgi:hypothetical protein